MKNEIRCSIEIRADDSRESPGRITGTLITYGQRASDRPELFLPGSLEWPERGIILNRQHSRTAPVMRVIPQVVDGAVVIDAALPDTSAGRDTATEIRQGLFTGLSVEFRSISQRFEGGLRKIAKAALSAAAIVDSPSYAGSNLELRSGEKRRRVWL